MKRAAVVLALALSACTHAQGTLATARCLVTDPGVDELLSPEHAAEVQAAIDRWNAGAVTHDDLALLADAATIGLRLRECLPKKSP